MTGELQIWLELNQKRTQGEWSQGRVLDTPLTRGLSVANRERMERKEKREVYANFFQHDNGMGRRFICSASEHCHTVELDHNIKFIAQSTRIEGEIKALLEENERLRDIIGVMQKKLDDTTEE